MPNSTLTTKQIETFRSLHGRGLHELRTDELTNYLVFVSELHGVGSLEFRKASDWIVSELERKTNEELVAVQAHQRIVEERAKLMEIIKEAPSIYDLMLRCSSSCKPMQYLLTTEGLYSFHMASLNVRDNGVEYRMEADWADNCGKLVKHLTEFLKQKALIEQG